MTIFLCILFLYIMSSGNIIRTKEKDKAKCVQHIGVVAADALRRA